MEQFLRPFESGSKNTVPTNETGYKSTSMGHKTLLGNSKKNKHHSRAEKKAPLQFLDSS